MALMNLKKFSPQAKATFTVSEKTWHNIRRNKQKNNSKRDKKMTFDATFKYLKIIVDMKTKTKREFHKREM